MAAKKQSEIRSTRLPAPLGGLTTAQSVLDTPPSDALYLDNLIPRTYGLELRKGWRYWYDDTFDEEVRTLMQYVGSDPSHRRLFCSTAESNSPIYDVTTTGATAPTVPVLAPIGTPVVPGEWSHTMFVTPGGPYLCTVCAGLGYYVYDNTSGWVNVPIGVGAGTLQFPSLDTTTPADFCFVMVWKNRLWFIKRNSGRAYYLPVNQIAGQLTAFDFGAKLSHGGSLHALINWTYDGGSGIDDSLVVVGDEGDLLIYQGTDPDSADTFGMKGVWFVGRMPVGRRAFAQQGGDVWFISEYGVVPLSDLVSGRFVSSATVISAANKYNPALARYVVASLSQNYWHLTPFPPENVLIMGSPHVSPTTGQRHSFIQNVLNRGWCTTTNFDPLCSIVYDGKLLFGTRNNRLCQGMIGYRDSDNHDSSYTGDEVTGRFIGGFFDLGSPTKNKLVSRVRMLGIGDGQPTMAVAVRPEYDQSQLLSVSSPVVTGGALWDVGVWDLSLWQYPEQTFKRWIGVSAYGKKMSVQAVIRGTGYTLVTDYEVTFKEGYGL